MLKAPDPADLAARLRIFYEATQDARFKKAAICLERRPPNSWHCKNDNAALDSMRALMSDGRLTVYDAAKIVAREFYPAANSKQAGSIRFRLRRKFNKSPQTN